MYPPTVARETPDAAAYLMAPTGECLTYAELDERSNALAHLLRRSGVGPGQAIALFLPNDLSWPVVVAAGMRSGLLVTPLNWHVRPAELAPMLADARPAAVVTTVGLAPVVLEVARGLRQVPPMLLTVDGEIAGSRHLWTVLDGLPTSPIADEMLGARVLFSGGTTGQPKAFRQPLLGVHPLDAPPRHPALARALGIERGIRLLSPAPSYHAAPFTFQLMTLAAGGTVVCMDRFEAAATLSAIRRFGVTHSQWVPTMLSRLAAVSDRPPPSPQHQVAVTSGGPCAPELKDAINDWWGDILHEYYGASEGYGHTYISPAESHERRGSVGRALGAARVRVVDDRDRELAPGKVGRVCFEQPGEASAPLLRGMGDMGHVDADGYLYLAGRQSFVVISGGVNIYPEEIETVLLGHPEVADVAVFGVPHADLGEQVLAVVQLAAGSPPGPDAESGLLEYCRNRLAHFKVPRVVNFVPALPRTATGKLNKRALQRQYLATSSLDPSTLS